MPLTRAGPVLHCRSDGGEGSSRGGQRNLRGRVRPSYCGPTSRCQRFGEKIVSNGTIAAHRRCGRGRGNRDLCGHHHESTKKAMDQHGMCHSCRERDERDGATDLRLWQYDQSEPRLRARESSRRMPARLSACGDKTISKDFGLRTTTRSSVLRPLC